METTTCCNHNCRQGRDCPLGRQQTPTAVAPCAAGERPASSIKGWQMRMPEPRTVYCCDMNCSPCDPSAACGDCVPVKVHGDSIVARDAEIAELRAAVDRLSDELQANRRGETVRVEYNLAPAQHESAIRNKLIEMGWTPPHVPA